MLKIYIKASEVAMYLGDVLPKESTYYPVDLISPPHTQTMSKALLLLDNITLFQSHGLSVELEAL